MNIDTSAQPERAPAVPSGAVAASREKAPAWARFFYDCTERSLELGGGPRITTVQWAVNFHKIVTAFLIYGMMIRYDNYSVAAWVYLGLHGTYGYAWLIKDLAYPNAYFEKQRMTVGGIVYLYAGLIGWYWLMPWLLIARHVEPAGFVVFKLPRRHRFLYLPLRQRLFDLLDKVRSEGLDQRLNRNRLCLHGPALLRHIVRRRHFTHPLRPLFLAGDFAARAGRR